MPLDYAKRTSGVYPDEFLGKAVVVEGYLIKGMQMRQIRAGIPFLIRQYSQAEIMQKARKSPIAAQSLTTSTVSAVAPMSTCEIRTFSSLLSRKFACTALCKTG